MKKYFLPPILTALTVVLFSYTLNASPWPPVRSMVLTSAWQAMVIDGVDAEGSYGELQDTEINFPAGWDGTDEDFSAVFRLTWDYSFLYVYAEITDDSSQCYKEGYETPWSFDNCEVFLQLDTNTVVWGYSPVTAMVQMNRGYTAIQYSGHADSADFLYSARSNPNSGWTFEMGIPWKAAMPIGSASEDVHDYLEDGKVIGFDIRFIDADAWYLDPTYKWTVSEWDPDDPEEEHDIEWPSIYDHPRYFGYLILDEGNLLADSHENPGDILVYPNPVVESIQFLNLEKRSEIRILNCSGVEVLKIFCNPSEGIDISSLQSGLYLAVIGGKESIKFIKE